MSWSRPAAVAAALARSLAEMPAPACTPMATAVTARMARRAAAAAPCSAAARAAAVPPSCARLSFGLPGAALHGGDGGFGLPLLCPSGGGGGGSGYYGGGGGSASYSSGGGGSSFPHTSQTINGITVTPDTTDNNLWTGDGEVTISYSLLPTSTSVNCVPNPSAPGQSVTCTATVTPAVAGNVNFEANGSTIAGCGSQVVSTTGTAQCTTTTLPNGSNTITAIFSPTNTMVYEGSSGTTTQDVQALTTHMKAWLVVHSNGTYTLFGQLTYDFSGLSGETVTFNAGRSGPLLCTTTTGTGGIASCLLTRAQTAELLRYQGAFTASFAGDGAYGPSSAFYPGILWF